MKTLVMQEKFLMQRPRLPIQRLNELQETLAAAKRNNPQQAERIEQEIDVLQDQLRHAVGMNGHDRFDGAHIERARVNVKRAIDAALQKIEPLI